MSAPDDSSLHLLKFSASLSVLMKRSKSSEAQFRKQRKDEEERRQKYRSMFLMDICKSNYVSLIFFVSYLFSCLSLFEKKCAKLASQLS